MRPADHEVQKELNRRFGAQIKRGKWKAVAEELGVNRGDLHGVFHGQHWSNKVRVALGLDPYQQVEVIPCACGNIHVHSCQNGRQVRRRRKSSQPDLLQQIQEKAVPWLSQNLNGKE